MRIVTENYLDWSEAVEECCYTQEVRTLSFVSMGAVCHLTMNVACNGDVVCGMSWPVSKEDDAGYVDEPGGGGLTPDSEGESERSLAREELLAELLPSERRRVTTEQSHCTCWDRGRPCCYCGSDEEGSDGEGWSVCRADRSGKKCAHSGAEE